MGEDHHEKWRDKIKELDREGAASGFYDSLIASRTYLLHIQFDIKVQEVVQIVVRQQVVQDFGAFHVEEEKGQGLEDLALHGRTRLTGL